MTKKTVSSEKLPSPVGPFVAGVRSNGHIFTSGQIAQDKSGKLIEGDVSAEARQVLENLGAILEASGKTFDDVVRVGIYLTNMADFSAVNQVYADKFQEPYPARTCIAVSALPLGAIVEMDAIIAD